MFEEIELIPFENKIWLSTPTMHGDELKFMAEAYETNWMSTVGENINAVEAMAAKVSGKEYAVGLTNGTAALHMAMKLAGEQLYGRPEAGHGALEGKKIFCSDMTFAATVNPVLYEGGIPVFIDTDPHTWNMDPECLEKAFAINPEVKLVVFAELYGFPGGVEQIRAVCEKHGALLIEDAAEALGATVNGRPCGSFGDYGIISYNGNKIITGSAGGCLLTDSIEEAEKVRKWSTQSREAAPWYQHEEIGYNYRMSNVIAGVVRGQYPYLEEHIEKKRAIYERYQAGFKDLPVQMNPITQGSEPNYWLSCFLINEDAMCEQVRTEKTAFYNKKKTGTTCPTEILERLAEMNVEGRPIWKPMHLHPFYQNHGFIQGKKDVGLDIFERGVCLPSDIKMKADEQEMIIEVIRSCFEEGV